MPSIDLESSALTKLGAAELVQRMRVGSLLAVDVVDSFLARIDEVQPALNAMVYRRDDLARQEAASADARQQRGETLGPLHGLPVTVKECFALAGSSATMGLARLANQPATEDGPLVVRLKNAGAIILGKTNVPQLMLMHETDSPLFGRANHPLDPLRSPGGSSGGEAAILAANGSALGIGTDLGGSIRQPAHCCGVCGLMPTAGRLTALGCRLNYPRLQSIRLQPGVMARNVTDLTLAMRVLAPTNPDSAQADEFPLPWIDPEQVDLTGVRVAMYPDDGVFTPSPAVRRAVLESADRLRQAGLVVEEFVPPGLDEVLELYIGMLSADGMKGLMRLLESGQSPPEEVDWRIGRLIKLGKLPNWTRPILSQIAAWRGQQRLARLILIGGNRTGDGYLQLVARLGHFAERFYAALAAGSYSALLFPAHGLAALTHGSSAYLLAAATYCFLPNLLGIPAGVVPVTHVRPDEESDRSPSRDRSERTASLVEAGSAGLPVGVQVASLPWREDLVLALMQLLEHRA